MLGAQTWVLQGPFDDLGVARAGCVEVIAPVTLAQQPDASGVYKGKVGGDLELPQVKKSVRPKYTREARNRGIEGVVWLEAVVLPDGKVGEVVVTKSLDGVHGLDQAALKAARKWRFTPGRKHGKPVPVSVIIELTFTLR